MRHPNNRTLGEICDEVGGIIRTGPFGSQLHQSDYREDGLPVIMPKDIVNGKVETDGIARIGKDDEFRLQEHKLKKGDIVFARRGDIGRCSLIHEREDGWLCGTGSLRVSLGDTVIDPVYLYYYFNHDDVVSWIRGRAIGATMPNLNTSIFRDIPISYPPLSIQRRIADILSAYDDLIENNTRRIRILEQMAQAVYQEWFGKVDKESLPKGWEELRLGAVFDIRYGKNLPTKDMLDVGDFPVYGAGGVIGYHDKSVITNRVPLVTCRGNGSGTIWRTREAAFITNNNLYILPQSGFEHFEFFYIESLLKSANVRGAISGSAQPQITIDGLSSVTVIIPPKILVQKYCNIVRDIPDMVDTLYRKNVNLRQTRDLLLPRLVSGEIELQ